MSNKMRIFGKAIPMWLITLLLIVVGAGAAATIDAVDPSITGYATATDSCDPDPSVTHEDVVDMSGCGGYTGTVTRTWTAADACGNYSSCVQTIAIVDNTPPVITCPPSASIECDESGDPSNTGYATATDNCDPDPSVTYSDVVNMTGCGGTITRTWTATDACGNYSSCVQTITIVDDDPPVITCPPSASIECDESRDPSNTGYATATDACDPSPSVCYSDVVDMTGCGGTITRTWTATDACGNYSSCVQIITIVDTTPPVLFCPPDVIIDCDEFVEEPPDTDCDC